MKGRVLIAVALAVAACGTYAVRAAVNPDALWPVSYTHLTLPTKA